jgi:hypothetical protein
MNDYSIVFEKVSHQKYSVQGNGHSQEPGYHIWLRYSDGWMDLLGYIVDKDLEYNVSYYQSKGDVVEIRETK